MNKLMMTGRLTRDAQAGATQGGRGYLSFTLAVNRDYKNPDGTVPCDFINVFVSRPTSEMATKFASYLKKGTAVEVVGSLRSKTTDNADGTKTTMLNVVADNVHFALTNASQNTAATTPTPAPATVATPTPAPSTTAVEVNDDDLPF